MRNDDIRHAARLLIRVLRGEQLETAVEVAGASLASPRIRAWVYGVCRHYFSLAEQLSNVCLTPLHKLNREVLAVLLLGVFQLMHTSAKRHAVVSESVSAIKRLHKQSAAALINAVLRKVDKTYKPSTLSGKTELPNWFIKALQDAYGESIIRNQYRALNSRMPQCLRVNRRKISPNEFLKTLQKHGIGCRTLGGQETICLCKPQPSTTIPGYAEGWFSVQDANAQIPVHHLDIKPGFRVLDACAAPGNKAFQLLEHDIQLTALDINPSRRTWSETEGRRLGLPLSIIQGDAKTQAWWDGKPFDRILVDAPCSATGTIGRHPDVKLHRTMQQLPELQCRQSQLLRNLWETLAVDGILVYCTCSLLPHENDQAVDALRDAKNDVVVESLDLEPSIRPLILPQRFGIQIFPDPDWGDGFYIAKLRKRAGSS